MDFCLLGLVKSTFTYFTASNSHKNCQVGITVPIYQLCVCVFFLE